jgi:hypothetical protein
MCLSCHAMKAAGFELEILELSWVLNVDDPFDLCAHGCVYVKIGSEVLSNEHSGSVTVSAAALFLLRTLKAGYNKGQYDSPLIPCCGHLLTANENSCSVDVSGCPFGIDWTIARIEDGNIRHSTEAGQFALVSNEIYRQIVFEFADRVEDFYKMSLPKSIPSDAFERNGYLAFWREWRAMRDE